MRLLAPSLLATICVGVIGFVWFADAYETNGDSAIEIQDVYADHTSSKEPISPLPSLLQLNPRKVALGQKLFDDKRLSRDGTIACASCHDLRAGGDDGRVVSVGLGGALGGINAPTVFNSGLNFAQFWDGRAGTLEDQIDGPIQHPQEMGTTWPAVIARLRIVPDYAKSFGRLYPDGMTVRNIKDAIATFERSLVTPNSRFDRFLNGDGQAITEEEHKGYTYFKSLGCVSCHQGINIGGNMFQPFGVMLSRQGKNSAVSRLDLGRYNVTGLEEDKFVFKVPSLRNVALTAPYFHDGSAPDLPAAVRVMAEAQLGRRLTDDQVRSIVAFLNTLTGVPRVTALR